MIDRSVLRRAFRSALNDTGAFAGPVLILVIAFGAVALLGAGVN